MKTSNKILLVLAVIVFTIPFLLAMTLKNKMKKGEYTVVKYENDRSPNDNTRSGSFTAYKVVKVVAPNPDFFTCRLKLSGNMNYEYFQHSDQDSISVSVSNDTLLIRYMPQVLSKKNEETRFNQTTIHVKLPSFNNLVADGAVVIIDSMPASMGNLTVTLRNRGQIKDGSDRTQDEPKAWIPSHEQETPLTTATTARVEVTNSAEENNIGSIKKLRLKIPDLNLKDMLIYRLLYRF